MTRKKALFIAAKVIIGGGLIALVVVKIAPQWQETWDLLQRCFTAELDNLLVAAGLFFSVCLIGTWRWQLLLRAHSVRLPFPTAFRLFFIGHFFSQYMPGGLAGGDVIKSYYVATHTRGKRTEAVATVWIDRFIGIIGLVGVLVVALMVNIGSTVFRRDIVTVLIVFAVLIAGTFLLFNKPMLKRIGWVQRLARRLPYRDAVLRVYDAFYLYKDHPLVLTWTFLMSVGVHLILTLMTYVIAVPLGTTIPFRQFLIIVPLINFVGSIPVSPSGNIGTFDWACIWFIERLQRTGPATAIAGALAILIRGIYFFWGFVGFFVWITTRTTAAPPVAVPDVEGLAVANGQQGLVQARPEEGRR